jgi:23S rRNA (adenine2030-N6)-methyltransferase
MTDNNNDEYSHLEQAGNHGDVLKHVVLRAIIQAQQEAHAQNGILFVDTHCGPGQYDLSEQKSAEYEKGISRIANEIEQNNDGVPTPVQDYYQIVKSHDDYLQIYPGSPIIAERLMRPQDEQRLCDAVVNKVNGIKNNNNNPTLQNGDAFHPDALDYFMPKTKMHPVIFIDPSYVDADDFHEAKQLMERYVNVYFTCLSILFVCYLVIVSCPFLT